MEKNMGNDAKTWETMENDAKLWKTMKHNLLIAYNRGLTVYIWHCRICWGLL